MNFIKPWLAALTVAGVTGCATSTPSAVLSVTDTPMIDIYRQALTHADAATDPGAGILDTAALCHELGKDDLPDCQQRVSRYLTAALQDIDADTPAQTIDYSHYTRSAQTELESLFPRLSNPDIVIYVYPHLATRTRAPIPGYATAIPLYRQVEYRLPGEALLPTPAPDQKTRQESHLQKSHQKSQEATP